MGHDIFGNEDAKDDDLLRKCFVEPSELLNRPIIVGRWGIGKTAVLFHQNAILEDTLNYIDPENKQLWYIGEHSIDKEGWRSTEIRVFLHLVGISELEER